MALQATRNDGLVEVGKPVGMAGTIDPPIGFGPVRNGQFKELLPVPIQVGLPLSSGTDHEVETLLVSDGLGRRQFCERGLEIAFRGRTHHKKQRGIRGSQSVETRRELACNRSLAGNA
jgi:hypothetical protein